MRARSVLAGLAAVPRRFRFDAAVRVLARARRSDDPAEVMRFRTPGGLVYPPADVLEVDARGPQPEVMVGMMGLTGPSGVLPRSYTEIVTRTRRNRSTALHEFLDLLGHRFVGFFARAAMKYRPARAAEVAALRGPDATDTVTQTLLALTGFGTGNLAPRLPMGVDPVLHYAGIFAMRPRSADRLGAMLSDWLGMRVQVEEFAGAWLNLPVDQRTRIGAFGAFSRLSVDAAAGVRAWDPQARFVLRIGPLDRAGFEQLLPDRLALHRLVALTRAYVGFELGFAVNPVLAARDVPPLRMGSDGDSRPQLGWNTWLPGAPGSVRPRGDAADAVFEAEVIEAQRIVGQGVAA
ncbi:MAG TPA: type VI secretion system baseplate subunit TssG [Acetobacteraceae bacterium]|nr:type VI secretion system baseplate subunit TssG [Acetobacteraceae bacterium]